MLKKNDIGQDWSEFSITDIASILPTPDEMQKVLNRKVKDLPALPLAAIKLLEVTRDDTSSARDLAKVVETDPAITAKIIKIVNSAAYGMQRTISSVTQAISLLGFLSVRSLALAVILFEHMLDSVHHEKFDKMHFWQHCLAVATLSRSLAREIGYDDPEEAYVGGLIHDIGQIILDAYGCIRYSDFISNLQGNYGNIIDEERKIIGLSHDEIGAYFCADWQMPDALVCAVKFHHRPFRELDLASQEAKFVAIVSFANYIAGLQGLGGIKGIGRPFLAPEVEQVIDLRQIDLSGMLHQMDLELKSTAEFYHFEFPSSDQLRENLLWASIELGKINAQYSSEKNALERKLQTMSTLKGNLVQSHLSRDTKEVVKRTLRAIQKDFQFDRLYLMEIRQNRKVLVTTASINSRLPGMDISAFQIPVYNQTKVFIDSLRNNQPFVITGQSQGEMEILKYLQAKEMGAVPFSNSKRVIGILGVDNVFSGQPIDVSTLSAVSIFMNELGVVLESAKDIENIREKASMDALTKVFNRGHVEVVLTKAFADAQGGNNGLAVAMIDIDFFKKFNDDFGHLTGDGILHVVAETLKRFTRNNDIVGRYGGEEFIAVLVDADMDNAMRYGERIRLEIEKLGKLLVKRFPGRSLTVSVGIAAYHPSIQTKEELIAQADKALYQAKDRGRNKVVGRRL